jgi:hypothetical protein
MCGLGRVFFLGRVQRLILHSANFVNPGWLGKVDESTKLVGPMLPLALFYGSYLILCIGISTFNSSIGSDLIFKLRFKSVYFALNRLRASQRTLQSSFALYAKQFSR